MYLIMSAGSGKCSRKVFGLKSIGPIAAGRGVACNLVGFSQVSKKCHKCRLRWQARHDVHVFSSPATSARLRCVQKISSLAMHIKRSMYSEYCIANCNAC